MTQPARAQPVTRAGPAARFDRTRGVWSRCAGAVRFPRVRGRGRPHRPRHAAPGHLHISPLFACLASLSLVAAGATLGSLGTGGAQAAGVSGAGAGAGAEVRTPTVP